jgi:flavin-dependent dehydrogenase
LLIPAIEYEIEVPEEDFERLSKSVRFDIDAAPFGYGWCFPKNNHLSVGVGVLKTKAKVKLKDYCESYMKDLGINTIISESAHGFVIPVTPRAELVKGNCFVIGDAAGFADPIVAEGISNALLSGKIIAEAISDGNLEVEKTKEKYIEKVNEKLIPELKIGIKLAKFFYENTTIRNLFVKNLVL